MSHSIMFTRNGKLFTNRLLTVGENMEFDERRQFPPFYDPIKYKRGQSFFREYFTSICLAYIVGLSLGLSDPKLNFILRHTNNSSQPKTAYKRYYRVVKHILMWMELNFENPTVWKSLKVVQYKHAKVGKSTKMIKQRDLGLATLGFIGPLFVNLELFGISSAKTEDLEAFLHMWRNLSYVMGTNDLQVTTKFKMTISLFHTLRFNACTTESVEDVTAISKEITKHLIAHNMRKDLDEYHSMLDAFCRGFSIFIPIPNERVMVEYCKKNIVKMCDTNFTYRTDYSFNLTISVKVMEMIGYIQRFKIVRLLTNILSRFIIRMRMS